MKDYRDDFDRVHDKLDKIDDKLGNHIDRIARLEATQKGAISVITAIFTAIGAALLKLFNIGA